MHGDTETGVSSQGTTWVVNSHWTWILWNFKNYFSLLHSCLCNCAEIHLYPVHVWKHKRHK